MAYIIKGKITYLSATQTIQGRTMSIDKREMWIAPMRFDAETGEPTQGAPEESVRIDWLQDKCKALDSFKAGDEVQVAFTIRGRVSTNRDGNSQCFNSLEGRSCRMNASSYYAAEAEAMQQEEQAAQNQQGFVQQQVNQPATAQQMQQQVQQQFAQQQYQAYQQQQMQQGNSKPSDGLPF